jgi:mannose-6-phosphate isomerase
MQKDHQLQGTKMLYPYRFTPLLVERVWGGHNLARYGKPVHPVIPIGESWEISDRDGARTLVANGPLKNKTIRQLIEILGPQLVGANAGNPRYFPLLVKLLDCRERLSLQVHPPSAIAASLGGEPKTEMWYTLEADPGAHLIAGLRRGVTREDFIHALEWLRGPRTAPQPKSIEDCVYRFPVAAGDAFFVPSGRLHAIDAGVVLVEIQQNSDTTFRVYDWDRLGLDGKPRQLHVLESLACIDFQDFEPKKVVPQVEDVAGNTLSRLVECDKFHVHKIELRNAWLDRCDGASFHIIACLKGALGILTPDGKTERLAVGEFALLPAALGPYSLAPQAEVTHAMKVFIPKAA